MNELFSHTISRVDFIEGMVRIEFANLAPGETEVATVVPTHILHMPLGGFMRGAVTLENFIRELVSRGILPNVPAAPAPTAPASPTASPNFG
jgi:hypothetical protein